MGSLICWENYMPLARTALYQKGVSLYLAPNTNDNPEWQDTIKHIAIEGRCYVFNVDQYFTKDMYPADLVESEAVSKLNQGTCRGGSCIIDRAAITLPNPSGTRKPSSTPTWTWTKSSCATWNSMPLATTPGQTSWNSSCVSRDGVA